MRGTLLAVAFAITACSTSSNNDTSASGGGNAGDAAAGSGASAGTGGHAIVEAGAAGIAEAGAAGFLEAGAAGAAQAGQAGDNGAANEAGAGGATAGAGGTPSGGNGGTGGASGGTGGASCSTPMLVGGTDVTTQGWSVHMQAPATISYGADYVRLATSTPSGEQSGGQLLLYYPAAFVSNQAFKIKVEMLVESVSPHNQFDSGAAILGSLTGTVGTQTERGEMVYLDSAAVGWSDNAQSAAFNVTDGAYHSYELSVDATGAAQFSVDGTVKLTRTGYTTNGVLAIGDQTNDANVDGTMRIRAVTRECP